ncbi:hypothetical protein [Sporomusa sphaeroides]|uniref:hypothetical protein n=1 Tax=Sporomusa sphaeroides TaxID=47679 RepID=UPI00202F364A|nr:hypothetical protein [Sporomusa sphaeroides]MCM0759212.1 hypothetical protein [Sporomusa sphaeroides DSM 2875]HML35294.1 hypothetical protein [Sporomusa sphaeroides]
MHIYYAKNRSNYHGHKELKYWANGVPIGEGYIFKTPGKKTITIKYQGKQGQYDLQVFPANLGANIKECYILNAPPEFSYRQTLDLFDPSDITVRCVYTNGATDDFRASDLEFYANGVKLSKGYKFKEAGNKNFVIRLGNYNIKQTLTVVPAFDKAVSRYELINQPDQTKYKVGEAFHTCKYTVRCYFEDNTTADFSGDQLDITANGVQMHENYVFVSPGDKKIIISLGGFRQTSTLTVGK